MFGSEILEVAIGVTFVFLLVSVICAAVREGIEGWLKTRAAYLEFGIRELLHDRRGMGLAGSFFNHPLIYGLYSGEYPGALSAGRPSILARGVELPSYIPSRNFALALMDLVARGPTDETSPNASATASISLDSIRANVLQIDNPPVQRMLLVALDAAQNDLGRFQAIIEDLFDSAMDRISGMYKRSTQWIIFAIGFFAAVLLNINAIAIAQYLYRNDTTRSVIVAAAEGASQDTGFLQRSYAQARQDLAALRLPIGWEGVDFGWPGTERVVSRRTGGGTEEVTLRRDWWSYVFSPLLGWLLTALAATLGAPFWFDVLNKFMVIRSTVKPHEKSPEEASEDRQLFDTRRITLRSEAERPTVTPTASGATPVSPIPSPSDLTAASTVTPAFVRQPAFVREPASVRASADADIPTESDDDALDGCDVEVIEATPDEELPAAEGGVA
ncbi:MAG TPA: hypothetical protein VF167_08210 [Longimicrobiaceae bacterium]